MPIDILIFAAVAIVLIFRLKSLLGTRHDHDVQYKNPYDERNQQKDQVAPEIMQPAQNAQNIEERDFSKPKAPETLDIAGMQAFLPDQPDHKATVLAGLTMIKNADHQFDPPAFIDGARYAFEVIVEAFYNGERETLKDLLSDTLYHSFEQGIIAREAQGHRASITIHAITNARIVEAKLNGVMAYVTVDFDVEESITVKDSTGQLVDGSPDHRMTVRDIWTFARDVRAIDPNWQVIATRAGDNA